MITFLPFITKCPLLLKLVFHQLYSDDLSHLKDCKFVCHSAQPLDHWKFKGFLLNFLFKAFCCFPCCQLSAAAPPPPPLNLGSLKVKGPCVQKLCIRCQETGLNQDSSKAPELQLGGFVGLLVLVFGLGDTIWVLTVVLVLLYLLLYDMVNRGCR